MPCISVSTRMMSYLASAAPPLRSEALERRGALGGGVADELAQQAEEGEYNVRLVARPHGLEVDALLVEPEGQPALERVDWDDEEDADVLPLQGVPVVHNIQVYCVQRYWNADRDEKGRNTPGYDVFFCADRR